MSNYSSRDVEAWVEIHGDALFQYALTRLRNRAAAEDTVQETYLAALRGIGQFSGRSAVGTWLFGILKHKIVDQIRREARKEGVNPWWSESNLDDLFDAADHYQPLPRRWSGDPRADFQRSEFWDYFQACLGKMPKRIARVFVLRHIDGLSSGEICKLLEISTTNLWVMLHRGRLALRECLAVNWFKGDDRKEL